MGLSVRPSICQSGRKPTSILPFVFRYQIIPYHFIRHIYTKINVHTNIYVYTNIYVRIIRWRGITFPTAFAGRLFEKVLFVFIFLKKHKRYLFKSVVHSHLLLVIQTKYTCTYIHILLSNNRVTTRKIKFCNESIYSNSDD